MAKMQLLHAVTSLDLVKSEFSHTRCSGMRELGLRVLGEANTRCSSIRSPFSHFQQYREAHARKMQEVLLLSGVRAMCRKELVLAYAQSYGPQQKAGGGNQTAQSHVRIALPPTLVSRSEEHGWSRSLSERRGESRLRKGGAEDWCALQQK